MEEDLTGVKGAGAPLLAAGFRPFFLLAPIWSAIAVPVWLAAYIHGYAPAAMPAMTWHAHEMIYGYALAVVTGFVLTAIPNWTLRFPSHGAPLAVLAVLWVAARVALLFSEPFGAIADLGFCILLVLAVARELLAGRHWRGLPMLAALILLFAGNALVHLQLLGMADTQALGLRLGIATLGGLIALVGGRIIPSFTRNWLVRLRPDRRPPQQGTSLDLACLAVTLAGLAAWTIWPYSTFTYLSEIVAGGAVALRLSRWRSIVIAREPFLLVLHLGYAWLAFGLAFLGLNGFLAWVPPSASVHAITVGAVGTMTLGVMTRTSLRYGGRPLRAGAGTWSIYALVTLAAVLRFAAGLAGAHAALITSLAGAAWTAAFGLFVLRYGPLLARPRARPE